MAKPDPPVSLASLRRADASEGAVATEAASANGELPKNKPAPRPADTTIGPGDFNAGREDYLLWGLIAAVVGFIGVFFWNFTNLTITTLTKVGSTISCSPDAPELCPSVQRYALAVASLSAIMVRSNGAFLVGALVCLIGCMIVLRRLRVAFDGEGGSATLRTRVATDSPGVIIALLGGAILLATVLSRPHVELGASEVPVIERPPAPMPGDEESPEQRLLEYERRAKQRNLGGNE